MMMDVNCGPIIDGKAGIEEMGETIFRLILDTASGKKSKSENFGFGDNEFVPWHMVSGAFEAGKPLAAESVCGSRCQRLRTCHEF